MLVRYCTHERHDHVVVVRADGPDGIHDAVGQAAPPLTTRLQRQDRCQGQELVQRFPDLGRFGLGNAPSEVGAGLLHVLVRHRLKVLRPRRTAFDAVVGWPRD